LRKKEEEAYNKKDGEILSDNKIESAEHTQCMERASPRCYLHQIAGYSMLKDF
jgi:hypothetical protein